MGMIVRILISALAVFAGAYILPGVHVRSFGVAIIVAIILGLLNAFLKPVLVILTIPVTILTLGLFLLVINAVIILLCSKLVDGFRVDGFWYAMLFSIVVSLINAILGGMD